MEAGMPLYGHELGEETNALATGLGFAMNLDKHEDERGEKFIGQDALLETQASGGPRQTLVGLFIEGKRTARQHMKLLKDGTEVGEITSGCTSPTLGRPIAMAYVDKEYAEPGTTLDVDLGRDKTTSAEVTPLPFYKAPKK
jgi:aminomethyltransferase